MNLIKNITKSVLQIAYPNKCSGCTRDTIFSKDVICNRCIALLPKTKFEQLPNNLVEEIFAGRIHVEAATALLYFNKDSMLQHLMHLLKYKNRPDIGFDLGKMLGQSLKQSNRFGTIDYVTPVPLSKKRLAKRGYNQAMAIAEGIQHITHWPIAEGITIRIRDNDTQTKKTRMERWENMQNVFEISDKDSLKGKHVLLIDDVVTTGATLETCAQVLQQKAGARISIATVALAMQ